MGLWSVNSVLSDSVQHCPLPKMAEEFLEQELDVEFTANKSESEEEEDSSEGTNSSLKHC